MSASAPTTPPLQLGNLPNNYPVLLFSHGQVVHDVPDSGWLTRCGISTDRPAAMWLTLVQVQVWLKHAFCYECFTGTV
jgi:hypothetical protein